MATLEEMKAQYRELDNQYDQVQAGLRLMRGQLQELHMKIERATYTCPCVRLNKDLDIWDMSQQEHAGRRPLDIGVVADTLTADRKCPICNGKGIPLKDQKDA